MFYSAKRQQFLVDQGELGAIRPASMHGGTRLFLLYAVLVDSA